MGYDDDMGGVSGGPEGTSTAMARTDWEAETLYVGHCV